MPPVKRCQTNDLVFLSQLDLLIRQRASRCYREDNGETLTKQPLEGGLNRGKGLSGKPSSSGNISEGPFAN
ncbi:hypothetical protein DPEC_G00316310 [Dallia pectoralis]|uniref:Uncharacterized protein n=1 Tax=Dallia pectoralis TaxID=75939 RepID=A0ACC2FCR5_DALPE|nr:hypothetical protein DPEC_G00316310 [Dallia pectoralis]